MQKLIEFNENQYTPLYRPSHLQELKHRSEYFEVPDLDTKVQRHNNPHYKSNIFNTDSLTTLSSRMIQYLKSKFLHNSYSSFSDLTIN